MKEAGTDLDMILLLRSLPRMYILVCCGLGSSSRLDESCCCILRRYEEYLDSQITGTDMYYLEDVELARHLVELG